MSSNPYRQAHDRAFWSRAVGRVDPKMIDPVGEFHLAISPTDKVATAGSCFAQHIARHLAASGFDYHVAETAHPIIPRAIAESRQYGLFSARYGNIYTTRQLLQLLKRADGSFAPVEDVWIEPDGRVLDPFRPSVEPDGFGSEAEMREDRRRHLACVRDMLRDLDVFVFTLGLTECWMSRADGAVFPLCPGVKGGSFDPAHHLFHNLGVAEIESDMTEVVSHLRAINPKSRVLLTVSPVPLAATARSATHVLTATTYSKAVLRVAAENLARLLPEVHYFPSYEIVTGAHARGRYFADDLREVTEEGVAHVMRLFLQHATSGGEISAEVSSRSTTDPPVIEPAQSSQASHSDHEFADKSSVRIAERLVRVMCDEEAVETGSG